MSLTDTNALSAGKTAILGVADWIRILESDPDISVWQVWLGVREPLTRTFYYRLSGLRQKHYAYLPGAPMQICKGNEFTSRFERALECPAFVNLINLTFDFPPTADVGDHTDLDDRWIVSYHSSFTDTHLSGNEQFQKSTRFFIGLKGDATALESDAARLTARF